MRIIAGTLKGTRLNTPKSQRIRPTSDRIREYILSCIQTEVVDSVVLDLFAGTGAFGIEAISRGATKVVFVDNSMDAITLVRQNLSKVGRHGDVEKKSAETYLNSVGDKFDFIFCDPPYNYVKFPSLLQIILEKQRLTIGGTVIYESSSRNSPPQKDGFQITRQKKMGDTLITFYVNDYESCDLSRNL